MENANGVIKKLTSAERSYYTAAEVRERGMAFFRRRSNKKDMEEIRERKGMLNWNLKYNSKYELSIST